MSKKLLIVELDPGTQFLLHHALSEAYSIVAIVNDGYVAVDVAFNLEPDLVLLDIDLSRSNGINTIEWLKTGNPKTKVVVFSFNTLPQKIREIMEAGADAYCLKGVSLEELKKALSIAASGGTYLSSGIKEIIWKKQESKSNSSCTCTKKNIWTSKTFAMSVK
jgi:two-component system, NarL family, response regulator LiaR